MQIFSKSVFLTKHIYTLPYQKIFMFIAQTLMKVGNAEISKPSILVDFWHCLCKKTNVTYELCLGAKKHKIKNRIMKTNFFVCYLQILN